MKKLICINWMVYLKVIVQLSILRLHKIFVILGHGVHQCAGIAHSPHLVFFFLSWAGATNWFININAWAVHCSYVTRCCWKIFNWLHWFMFACATRDRGVRALSEVNKSPWKWPRGEWKYKKPQMCSVREESERLGLFIGVKVTHGETDTEKVALMLWERDRLSQDSIKRSFPRLCVCEGIYVRPSGTSCVPVIFVFFCPLSVRPKQQRLPGLVSMVTGVVYMLQLP